MSGKKDVFVSMTREQRDQLIRATRDAYDVAADARRRGIATQEAQELSDTCISAHHGITKEKRAENLLQTIKYRQKISSVHHFRYEHSIWSNTFSYIRTFQV